MSIRIKLRIAFFVVFSGLFVAFLFYLADMGNSARVFQNAKQEVKAVTATSSAIYKWQDPAGQWHFSDHPPSGVKAVAVQVDTTANTLESRFVQKKVPPPAPTAAEQPSLATVLNPLQAAKVLEQARQVKTQMEDRQQQLEAVMQQR